MATRAAKSQETGSGTLLARVFGADHLDQVEHAEGEDDEHGRDDQEERDPVGPDLGGKQGHEPIVPKAGWHAATRTGRSGDLAAPGPGCRHGFVLVAVLAVVVDRQLRATAGLATDPVLGEGL